MWKTEDMKRGEIQQMMEDTFRMKEKWIQESGLKLIIKAHDIYPGAFSRESYLT